MTYKSKNNTYAQHDVKNISQTHLRYIMEISTLVINLIFILQHC